MNQIKFSHYYRKMPLLIEEAFVLGINVCGSGSLPEEFKNWDSEYRGEHGLAHYKLPDGKVIVIFLYGNKTVFTTIRRWTEWKEVYYRNMIGQDVEIVVELIQKKQLQLLHEE